MKNFKTEEEKSAFLERMRRNFNKEKIVEEETLKN